VKEGRNGGRGWGEGVKWCCVIDVTKSKLRGGIDGAKIKLSDVVDTAQS
jgi:hypothetical protein